MGKTVAVKILALSTKRDVEKAFKVLLEEVGKGRYCSLGIDITSHSDGSIHVAYNAYADSLLSSQRKTAIDAVNDLIQKRKEGL